MPMSHLRYVHPQTHAFLPAGISCDDALHVLKPVVGVMSQEQGISRGQPIAVITFFIATELLVSISAG